MFIFKSLCRFFIVKFNGLIPGTSLLKGYDFPRAEIKGCVLFDPFPSTKMLFVKPYNINKVLLNTNI